MKISCGAPVDNCPIPIESPWGAGGYVLYANTTRRINVLGYNFCITNSSGYNYFVPGNSLIEITSFYNATPSLPGLTIFN